MRPSRFFLFILPLIVVFSCKPKVPKEYLQPDEFEDILYDYHLADAMANREGNADVAYNSVLYRQAVLKKYGITQAEFDSSLVYYMRHADRLHGIYENLTKRFEDEAMALGASANDIRRYGDMTSVRDTSNMWTGVPSVLLMTKAPYNVMTFDIAADSSYHKGDKLILSFNCDFIYKDGVKEAIALLAIKFKNDSVASSTVRMSTNSNYTVTVADNANKGIKSISGFIYLNDRNSNRGDSYNSSLKLMFIDNIRLIRMRGTGQQDATQPLTLQPQSRLDTLSKPNVTSGKGGNDKAKEPELKKLDSRLMPATGARPLKISEDKPMVRKFENDRSN